MSARPCNRCVLSALMRQAAARDEVVLTRPNDSTLGGVDVFVHGPKETPDLRSPDDGGRHWVCWFNGSV